MNVLELYTTESPYGKEDECAKLSIFDTAEWFILSDTTTVGLVYTFSAWIKSDADGSFTVGESYIKTTTKWVKYKATFTADDVDLKLIFSTPGTYYLYNTQLELGNLASDWSPSPEDVEDNLAEDLNLINEDVVTIYESIAELNVKSSEISASVSEIKTNTESALDDVNHSIETLTNEVSAKMSAEAVELQIKSAIGNGTNKVTTETGFVFDDEGLTIEKFGSEMKTQITEDGMTVYQNEEPMLVADNKGVEAKDLHAKTYLIVGGRSRFENYGTNRTGCFWIGG